MEEDAMTVCRAHGGRDAESEARLPGAAGPRQRQETGRPQQVRHLVDLSLAPDEVGQLEWQGCSESRAYGSAETLRETGHAQLCEMLGLIKILEPMHAQITQAHPVRQGSFGPERGSPRRAGPDLHDRRPRCAQRDGHRARRSPSPPTQPALAGVHADSHLYRVAIRPGLLCQPLLHGHRPRATALGADWKAAKNTSPSVLTSAPSNSARAWRRMTAWRSSTSR